MNKWFDNIIKNHYNTVLGFKWRDYTVSDLKFNGNSVSALVIGDDGFSDVNITFRQFSDWEKDKLLAIANEPDVKLDLIKGIIPDVLFNCGVDIFPVSSSYFIVDCSCGSIGFLCKEAVALLNRLNDIFKYNPFLIFSLRGLDLNNIDLFPVKSFTDIFNSSYNTNLSFLLDDYLDDHIRILLNDLNYLIEDYDFEGELQNLQLPLNLNSDYQITNNSFKNSGDFISSLKSTGNPILEYAFDLIKNYGIIPEIFKIDGGYVYTRWIPSVKINIGLLENLVEVNGKSISKNDQI